MRTILHSDLNNFYASVECLNRPELRDKPVAVVGDAEARHGIVLAKNDKAKAYGIKTGHVIWEAKRLCPKLVTVGADFPKYLTMSKRVRKIYEDYTDRIEPFGIDECWLDVTASRNLFGSGEEIAETIRQRVKDELGITVSIGVSWNKIFAKLGSDMKKPDAITVVNQGNYKDVVWPLPVEELLYVGRATKRKLNHYNIKTIGELATADINLLKYQLGKWGEYLHTFANGWDRTPVAKVGEAPPLKSVGNSLTNYRDLENEDDVRVLVSLLADSVVSRCRDLGIYKVSTLHVWARDSALSGYAKQGKLPQPTLLTAELVPFAMKLFADCYPWRAPVRSVGVSVSGFVTGEEQLDMLRDETAYAKRDRLARAVESIRKRYGNRSVQKAIVLKDKRLAGADIKEEHVIHPENYFKK